MATVSDPVESGVAEDRAWMTDALCRDRGQWFFDPPRESQGQRERREAVARMFCQACPVQVACRTYAREHHEHGFWGGENEEERTRAGYMPRSTGRRSVLKARREGQQAPEPIAS